MVMEGLLDNELRPYGEDVLNVVKKFEYYDDRIKGLQTSMLNNKWCIEIYSDEIIWYV